MSSLRAAAFNLLFAAVTLAIGVLALPVLALPREANMRFGRLWSRIVLWLLRVVVGLGYEVRGADLLPRAPYILALKHQSAWDAIVVPIVLDDPAVVVKRELLWVPIYGWFAARAGSIGIARKSGAAALRAMLAQARPVAAGGRPIVIFPQGTRVAPGAQLPYQPGVAALYRDLGLPLVPAAVNSGLFWGRRAFMKRPGCIILEFLAPIPPGQPRAEVMDELERRIEAATDRLLAEALGHEPGPARHLPAGAAPYRTKREL